MLDVVIIGAGVSGAFIARKLARYELKIALFERETDVGNVTSNANSAIVHSGYDPVPHTLKALLNVRGNAMFDTIADELDVHFNRCGSIIPNPDISIICRTPIYASATFIICTVVIPGTKTDLRKN